MTEDRAVIQWLMAGDPAIQWQTMRDLMGEAPGRWRRRQKLVESEGWGKRLLDKADPSGLWGGGIYSPKWTSSTYTLLLLKDMGAPRTNRVCRAGAVLIVDREIGALAHKDFQKRLRNLDLCIAGMDLSLLTYFDARRDGRIEALLEHLRAEQMEDGGWNCARRRHPTVHSSLHTTMNVLDGLLDYLEFWPGTEDAAIRAAVARAQEFVLQHRMFKSDKTGAVIDEAFRKISYPPRWHFDVLRGLEHFRRAGARPDERLQDAIELLISKCLKDGRWPLQNVHKGRQFFSMERAGQPSRWNTLRALRVLRWWEDGGV